MFTGIIEEIGIISSIIQKGQSILLTINSKKVLEDISLGDSIAVNGICLTVTDFNNKYFTADVMHETINRTQLNQLKVGSKVNLERAMKLNGRFGGHIVTGHIDGTGTIIKIKQDSIAKCYTIKTIPTIMKYIIEKGSIAIDGISLTVTEVTKDTFSISVIPHTMANTSLLDKKINDLVNLENDCIGKYIEKLMLYNTNQSNITKEFLLQNGF